MCSAGNGMPWSAQQTYPPSRPRCHIARRVSRSIRSSGPSMIAPVLTPPSCTIRPAVAARTLS